MALWKLKHVFENQKCCVVFKTNICFFQLRFASSTNDKILNTILFCQRCMIIIYRLIEAVIFRWGGQNGTKLDLSTFSDSLFAQSQLLICVSLLLTSISSWDKFLCAKDKLESSGNSPKVQKAVAVA